MKYVREGVMQVLQGMILYLENLHNTSRGGELAANAKAPLEGSSRAAGEGWPQEHELSPSHPSVTFGDSSPQGEPFARGAFSGIYVILYILFI